MAFLSQGCKRQITDRCFRNARRQHKEESQVFLVGDYFAPDKSRAALQRLPDLKADPDSFLQNAFDELDAIFANAGKEAANPL